MVIGNECNFSTALSNDNFKKLEFATKWLSGVNMSALRSFFSCIKTMKYVFSLQIVSYIKKSNDNE